MTMAADKAGARRITLLARVLAGGAALGAGALAVAQLPGLEPGAFESVVIDAPVQVEDDPVVERHQSDRIIDALAVHLSPEPDAGDGGEGDPVADDPQDPPSTSVPANDDIRYIGRLGSWAVVVERGAQGLFRVGDALGGGEVTQVEAEYLTIERPTATGQSTRRIPLARSGPNVVRLGSPPPSDTPEPDQDAARLKRLRDRQEQLDRDRASSRAREEEMGAEGR